jgi:transcriptional regulator GlxA family with amidase domain
MDPRIQRVVALMENHLNRRLTLGTMARVAGLSSSRLRHKFKAEMGLTPTTYLQILRLQRARELLTTHRLTVKQVKAAVGIESDSYFTHQYKRRYGITPSQSNYSSTNTQAQQ